VLGKSNRKKKLAKGSTTEGRDKNEGGRWAIELQIPSLGSEDGSRTGKEKVKGKSVICLEQRESGESILEGNFLKGVPTRKPFLEVRMFIDREGLQHSIPPTAKYNEEGTRA